MTDDPTNSFPTKEENLKKNSSFKKVFVTGGTGLVGSHLIEQLIAEGFQVKASYRKLIPDITAKEKVEWIKGDILDVTFLEDALEDIEHVYHCAAVVSFHPKQKQQMFATNVEGTTNVVNACLNKQVSKLCFVSSVAALGKTKKQELVDEETAWSEERNNSNYGKSKYLAEVEVWRGIGEGLEAVIVNPSIILGKGSWNEGSSNIFKTAYQEFPWYTDGATGFVDVKDLAAIMIRLMQSSATGERFIISAENRSYKDIFTSIAIAFNKKPPYKKVSAFMADAVWRTEAIKSLFTGESPLLTKETAASAQEIVCFNNTKILRQFPSFNFTPIDNAIVRICKEFKALYKLS